MEGLRRLGGSGTQASVELRRFDEFWAAEKLERVWVTPLSAEAVQGRYQTWLQAQGIMSQLSPRQISAALKSRQEVFVIQHNPRAAPLFSLVKFEEDAVPPRPLPALRPPPRAPMRGAVSATPKERALGAKCSTLQAKLGKVSQSLRNSQRSREAAVLKMKLERSRRAGKMAKWRSKRRAAISRSLRAVNGELAVQVSQLETRLYKLSHVSGATTSFLQTALLASAANVMAVRQELLSARDDASAAVDAAARSAAETARIEKELEKVAGPLHLREGGAVCDEVRAAAVAIAAGLEVSLGAVAPVMEVVLAMIEKLSLRQRGASLNVSGATPSYETVVRCVLEQGELEKFHIALRVYVIGIGDETWEYDVSDILEGSTAPETAAYLGSICLDVMRRQSVLMLHCGLAGITLPHHFNVYGMDNENTNPAALEVHEGFRVISETLEDMLALVEEAEINGVVMSECTDAGLASLKLRPRPPPWMPDDGPLAHSAAVARARARTPEIPARACLDKKPYVDIKSKPWQRFHDSFTSTRSIVCAAVRYQIVEKSQLQENLVESVAAHVAKFDGLLSLGAVIIAWRRLVKSLAARCGDHVLNINSTGIFREIGRLLGGVKVSKTTRIPMYTLLVALSRRILNGNFRDKFAGTYLKDHNSKVSLGRVTDNRFFSYGKGAADLLTYDSAGRSNLSKVMATFEKTKNDAGTEESYDAIINALGYDSVVAELMHDMGLHAVTFLLPIDKCVHGLSKAPRKLLEEARLLEIVIERLEATVNNPALCYDPTSLGASSKGRAKERTVGVFEKFDAFAYPSRDYELLGKVLLRVRASLLKRGRKWGDFLSAQLGGYQRHRIALGDWSRRILFSWFDDASLRCIALTTATNMSTARAVFMARCGVQRPTLDNDPLPTDDETATPVAEAEEASAVAAEIRPVHAIIKEAAAQVEGLRAETSVAARVKTLSKMSIEQRFVVLVRLEKAQPGAVRALASSESWAAFNAAATLTEKLALLKTLPGVERCAIYPTVPSEQRHELTLSTMAADLLRTLREYKGEMLKLVHDGDDETTLNDYGGGFRGENRCEERGLGSVLRFLRRRSMRLQAKVCIGLALSRRPTIELDKIEESVLRGLPLGVLRREARAARADATTHKDRVTISANGAAVKRSAAAAAKAATDKAAATTATTLANTLAATFKWTEWPAGGATVAELKTQLAHHRAVAKRGERLKINCDADGTRVTAAALTALGSIESKAKLETLVRLIMTDQLVVTREGPTVILRPRDKASPAPSLAASPEPPLPLPPGPHAARPLAGVTPVEHGPPPPTGQSSARGRRPPPHDKLPDGRPAKRRVTLSLGGAESPAAAPLETVEAVTARKRKVSAAAAPAKSSMPTRQRHAPRAMDV
ncbi:hypothetical protein M885DRAFT_574717 [Pelagophyceae sp. CCMP2097]|nr:hypothetical protein M885DRAFT_574717 [Pelagophyceae sp. CCMP2097]